jgi:putative FmdB family regulatory protein
MNEVNATMPLYEYRCKTCGQSFEKMIRFSEADHSPTCPACQSQDTQKKISTFASVGSSTGSGASTLSSSCGSSGRFS